MLISIIVPVYNNEKYLKKCIDSLIRQTYKNIEIILIDDGSSDSSLDICNEYGRKDKRIKVISQNNSGANVARHNGIKNSTGDYCMFVDSDDWIEKDSVEILINYLKEENYDIIKFNGITEPNKKLKNYYDLKELSSKKMKKEELFDLLINTKILNNMCFSIYKSKLFKNISVSNEKISNCEDFLTNLEVYTKVKNVLFISNILYHYEINLNSTTKNVDLEKNLKNIKDLIYVHNRLFDYAKIWKMDNDVIMKKISFNILTIVRSSVFNLFKSKKINKKIFFNMINDIFDLDEYNNLYLFLNKQELNKILKSKNFIFKIKYGYNISNLYKKNINKLWLNNYIYKLKMLFRG